jgi:hypothetical protein
MFCNQQQRFHRGLPFFGVVFGLGPFGNLLRGVAECHQFAPVGQLNRIVKPSIPRHPLFV